MMTDHEMQIAIAIAKEHWLEISNQTTVWLIAELEDEQPEIEELASIKGRPIREHGDYRFLYLPDDDELFIGRHDEQL